MDPEESRYCLVLNTCASLEEGKRIAGTVVSERLAACVNLLPQAISFYIWQESLQEESECLLLIKTQWTLVDALMERIRQLHSYQVPEMIVLPINRGNRDYFGWIDENLALSEEETETV